MKQKKIHSILIPVMCPSEIKVVLKQAIYFHEIFSSTITLLQVLPKTSFISRILTPNKLPTLIAKREAFTKLTLNIGAFFNNDIPDFINIEVKQGDFVSEVQKELRIKKYDLILLKECSKVQSLLSKLQAMSEKIISRVDCPVMIIHEKWTKTGINEILIPLDVTKKCKDTVLWALAHSEKLGAKINFVSIVNTNIKVEESLIYKRSRLIENWIYSLNIECSFEIIKSAKKDMAQTLLSYAEKGNSDLIMILTHEEFIASNNYLGKFAKEIIHQSPKPVISMSAHNQPMFKIISDSNTYRNNGIELLNLSKTEHANFQGDRNSSMLNGLKKNKTTIKL